MSNKIKYGLSKCYYAVATEGEGGAFTYGTPKALPGAKSITLTPQGETNKWYADDVAYVVTTANNGYEGNLELALLSDEFKKDCLGYVESKSGSLVEVADNADYPKFALLFEFKGDDKAIRHVFYNCQASRPELASASKEESIEPQTDTLPFVADSIFSDDLDKYITKMSTTDSTQQTEYDGWYTAVKLPTAQA